MLDRSPCKLQGMRHGIVPQPNTSDPECDYRCLAPLFPPHHIQIPFPTDMPMPAIPPLEKMIGWLRGREIEAGDGARPLRAEEHGCSPRV